MTTQPNNLNEPLSAFLDGELPADESAELERRLAADPALRLELEELAEVKRLVGHLPRVKAPAAVKAAVRAQLERRSLLHVGGSADRPARWWFRFVRIASAAAMLLIVSALTFAVWRLVNPAESPQPPRDGVAGNPPIAVSPPETPMELLAAGKPYLKHGEDGSAVATGDNGSPTRPTTDARDAHKGGLEAKVGQPARGGLVAPAATPPAATRVRAEGNKRLAEKFDQGQLAVRDIRRHRFEPEPVVLDVPVADAVQQAQVTDGLRRTLVRNGAVDVEELDGRTRLTRSDHQFVMQGKADRNFEPSAAGQAQIVARVRIDVAEKVIEQAQKDSNGQAEVEVRSAGLAEGERLAAAQLKQRAQVFEQARSGGQRTVAAAPGGESPRPAGPDVPAPPGSRPDIQPKAAGYAGAGQPGPASPADRPTTRPEPEGQTLDTTPAVATAAGQPGRTIGKNAFDVAGVSPPTSQPTAAVAQLPPCPAPPGERRTGRDGSLAGGPATQADHANLAGAGVGQQQSQPAGQSVTGQQRQQAGQALPTRDDLVDLVINVYVSPHSAGPAEQSFSPAQPPATKPSGK